MLHQTCMRKLHTYSTKQCTHQIHGEQRHSLDLLVVYWPHLTPLHSAVKNLHKHEKEHIISNYLLTT